MSRLWGGSTLSIQRCCLLACWSACLFYHTVWLWCPTFSDNGSRVTPKRFLRRLIADSNKTHFSSGSSDFWKCVTRHFTSLHNRNCSCDSHEDRSIGGGGIVFEYLYICQQPKSLFPLMLREMLKLRRTGLKERGTKTGTLRQRVRSLRPRPSVRPSARLPSQAPRPQGTTGDW